VILSVDPASAVPPYAQIRSQIASMVATGVLAVGTRLPAIRQLAGDLGLADGTVARAYRELEVEGVIQTRGRHGTFVKGNGAKRPSRESERLLGEAAHAFAVRASQLGHAADEAVAAVEHALRELDEKRHTA
jgi:DNA-binding transcriptional regulator YhcF (GntR family)